MVRCRQCQAENRAGRRFCAECGAPLSQACPACGFGNEPSEKFCGGCGQLLTTAHETPPLFTSPHAYTPKHLAEKILTSRSALEGERKQVTVLFCDLANSTALAERLGPKACTYRRTGRWPQAQEHLATATSMFREMDMRFWLEKAEAEMREP